MANWIVRVCVKSISVVHNTMELKHLILVATK